MNKNLTFWLNYFRPNIFVKSIAEVNIHYLKINGIKLLICDLDNTLVPHFSKFPNKAVFDFFQKVQREQIDLLIASNNRQKRVEQFVNRLKNANLNVDWLANCKKPLTKKIKKYLKIKQYNFEDIAIIGDQFITDIFLANRLKFYSILVLPVVNPNNQNTNRLINFLEKLIYRRLQQTKIINEVILNSQIKDETEEIL